MAVLLSLIASVLPAVAADTRTIYIGDPGGTNGSLTYTPTKPGGLTAVDIQVRNDGVQTINHATLLGGAALDAAPENPLFPKPLDQSLPDGFTYAAVFPADDCTISTAGDSLSCDLGTLSGGAERTYRVVIATTGPTAGTFETSYGVYLAEGNQTGTNQDNFYATGTITTQAAACTASGNTDANYFLPANLVSLTTADCSSSTGGQNAAIASKAAVGGQGSFGQLSIESTTLVCPAGYTCYGTAVAATVLDGGPVPGGLSWTIRWFGIRSLAGVIHFHDSYVAGDPDFGDDYTIITFKQKDKCDASLPTNCWTSTASSKGNESPSWFEATFVTPTNGRAGGLK
jgi:hypothetical protein